MLQKKPTKFEFTTLYDWPLSNERYEEIKAIVASTFEKYGISCVPVSGFELATKMGITVIPYSSYKLETQRLMLKESKDGFCAQEQNGDWYIFYNDTNDYGRINNTMLHEIGHIILDHSEDSEIAENEVKFFAKYALVPPILVLKFDLKNPEQIAKYFDVSAEAAGYAWEYYQKWSSRETGFTDYEIKILNQFEADCLEVV